MGVEKTSTAVSSEAWAKLRVWARVAGRGRLLLSGSVAHASLKTAVESKILLLIDDELSSKHQTDVPPDIAAALGSITKKIHRSLKVATFSAHSNPSALPSYVSLSATLDSSGCKRRGNDSHVARPDCSGGLEQKSVNTKS